MRLAVVLLTVAAAGAQMPSPTFDAASIKVNHTAGNGMGGTGITRTGSFSRRNCTLQSLMGEAYGIAFYQLTGLPPWASSERYDVDAKPDHAVDYDTAKIMVQNLLVERFQLQLHHEQASINGFYLTVARGGVMMPESKDKEIGFHFWGPDKIQGPGDVRMLTLGLRGIVQAPVENRTGLTAKYDVDLHWTPDYAAGPNAEPTVTIFAAVKDQLGLSLDATKVTVDRIVVDHAEHPTEN